MFFFSLADDDDDDVERKPNHQAYKEKHIAENRVLVGGGVNFPNNNKQTNDENNTEIKRKKCLTNGKYCTAKQTTRNNVNYYRIQQIKAHKQRIK